MVAKHDLSSQEETIDNVKEYKQIIISLQYITLTKPVVQYVVNELAQYMSAPSQIHWVAMKRTLRYIASTFELGITLAKEENFTSNWGGRHLRVKEPNKFANLLWKYTGNMGFQETSNRSFL